MSLRRGGRWDKICELREDFARGEISTIQDDYRCSQTVWNEIGDNAVVLNQLIENDLDLSDLSFEKTSTPAFTAMKMLLDYGIDLSPQISVLLRACIVKVSLCTFCLLLDRGVDVNDSRAGHSAMYLCSNYPTGRESFLKALIDTGADINITFSYFNWTPLMVACYAGSHYNAKLLLKGGANPNRINSLGETALHKAVKHNDKRLTLLLIDFGVDINAKDNNNQSAIVLANNAGHSEIVKLLRDHGANGEFPLKAAPSLSRKFVEVGQGIVRGLARGLPRYR